MKTTMYRPTHPLTTLALCLPTLTAALYAQEPGRKPLRLDDWLTPSDQLKVSGQHRTRFESLNGQFRNSATRNTEDQLFERTLLRVDYRHEAWQATLEGLDARAFGTAADSFANTTTVNTFDVLQAYASYAPTRGHRIAAGRWTMDVGSRRLVARNKYRNTINSFNGVRWDLQDEDRGIDAGAFWSMPTTRRPSASAELVDNEHDWDSQTSDYQFFGAHAKKRIDEHSSGQAYVFGLDDTRGSNDEQTWTIGGRYLRPARPGHLFGEAEAAWQTGERGTQDVDAFFVHGSTGFEFDAPMQPRVRVAIDVASGGTNGNNYGRFHTLFGARRFEYGPTGIYGAVGRRNLVSPELRAELRPTASTWLMLAWRDVRLESANDGWAEAGDTSGQGKHVGSQVECRLRWEPCKGNLRFEAGGAYFAGGRFRETSTAGRASDTRYAFFETIVTF